MMRKTGDMAHIPARRKPGYSGTGVAARQNGAVLIFCLVFLLALTLMGVSGMESTIMEERMAGNMQDHNLAFQSAETALVAAETWLASQVQWPPTSDDGGNRVWLKDSMDPDDSDAEPWWREPVRDTTQWWQNNAVTVSGSSAFAEPPRYIIEEYQVSTDGQSVAIGTGVQDTSRVFHRITARGTGRNSSSVVHLQSTFVKTYE